MHAISLLLLYAACLCSASWVATPVLLRSGADRNACFSAPVVLRAAVAPSPAVLMLAAKKAKKGKGGGGGGGGKAAGEEDAASGDSSDAEDLEEVVRDGEKKMKRSLANVSALDAHLVCSPSLAAEGVKRRPARLPEAHYRLVDAIVCPTKA
eukprot:scaffold9395_cov101-Isochrysis_galbana.AAC.1